MKSRLSISIAVAVILFSLAVQLPLAVNHDVAWITIAAGGLLHGASFGRDVIDVSPPLAFWLMLPVAAIAQATDLGLELITKLYIFALGLAGLGLSWLCFPRHLDPDSRAALMAVFSAVFFLLPGYDFGQREHIMVMLVLPYVLLSARDTSPHKDHWVADWSAHALAAVAVCLKPHFLFLPLLLEIYTAVRHGNARTFFRGPVMMMIAIGFSYALSVSYLAPGYLERVVPAAMASYGAYENSLLTVVRAVIVKLLPILFAAGIAWFLLRLRAADPLVGALAVAAGAVLASTLLQSKGWSYHMLPVVAFSSLAAARLTILLREFRLVGIPTVVAIAVIFVVVFRNPVDFVIDGYQTDGTQARVELLADAALSSAAKTPTVGAFVTSPRDIFPAIMKARAEWALPYCCLHLLPAVLPVNIGEPETLQAHEKKQANARQQVEQTIARLQQNPPDIIFVDAGSQRLAIADPDFDYIAYFSREPSFQEFWAGYVEQQQIGKFRVFSQRK